MKLVYLITVAAFISSGNTSDAVEFFQHAQKNNYSNVHNGDIIFQQSNGELSKAIQLATHSRYSHCGIIFFDDGLPYVYEAVQPVQKTPLQQWINRGEGKHYVIKSLADKKILTDSIAGLMKKNCSKFLGKNYDIYFEWSDDRIYCSELVWKVYKNVLNLEVGKVQQLKNFDLTAPLVKQKLKEYYGKNIPFNEKVISPQAIFESALLKQIAG
jgi:hypothetical protein